MLIPKRGKNSTRAIKLSQVKRETILYTAVEGCKKIIRHLYYRVERLRALVLNRSRNGPAHLIR